MGRPCPRGPFPSHHTASHHFPPALPTSSPIPSTIPRDSPPDAVPRPPPYLNPLLPLGGGLAERRGLPGPAQLEVKCIPFLDSKPHVEKLDLFTVRHVMAQPVVTLCVKEEVKNIVAVWAAPVHVRALVVGTCDSPAGCVPPMFG